MRTAIIILVAFAAMALLAAARAEEEGIVYAYVCLFINCFMRSSLNYPKLQRKR